MSTDPKHPFLWGEERYATKAACEHAIAVQLADFLCQGDMGTVYEDGNDKPRHIRVIAEVLPAENETEAVKPIEFLDANKLLREVVTFFNDPDGDASQANALERRIEKFLEDQPATLSQVTGYLSPMPWRIVPSTAHRPGSGSIRVDIVSDGPPFNPAFVAGDIMPGDAEVIVQAVVRWDEVRKRRWSLVENERAGGWVVQGPGQVVGNLGRGPTPADAIDAALKAHP